jgi:glucose-1-phosphate thymidylyltransferase
MKAVILCAGIGKRLRPFSYSIPKHLLPVNNQPVLSYLLKELAQENQVKEVAIIVSKETIDPIQEYLSENSHLFPFQFTYLFQIKPLGLAHACLMAESFVSDDEFIMLLGDNIIPGGVKAILDGGVNKLDNNDAIMLIRKVPDPRPYGVVEFDDSGNVISMEEKPENPRSSYVIVGIYRFKSSIFSSIHQIKPSRRGELEITDAIFHLKNSQKRVKAQIFDGIFLDIGNPESYLEANRYMIMYDKESSIDPSSIIQESHIASDVSIGAKTLIIDSELSNCIVLPNTSIKNSNLKNSIIGRNCKIRLNNQKEKAVQLIIGDDSFIEKEE